MLGNAVRCKPVPFFHGFRAPEPLIAAVHVLIARDDATPEELCVSSNHHSDIRQQVVQAGSAARACTDS